MQGGGSDADYAAAVLEGRVHTKGSWGANRPQQRRGGSQAARARGAGQERTQRPRASQGRGGAGAPADGQFRGDVSGGGSSSKKARQSAGPRRPWQQQQQQQQREHAQGSAVSLLGDGEGGTGGSEAAAAYSQPGPRSTARVAHCSTCDVFVPRRPGDWEVHVAGIRHRRQLLSLRVTGERNRLVLSAFENPPDSVEAAHRLVGGKAAQAFGLLPAEHVSGGGNASSQAPPPSPELLQAARQLRTEALKQLLNMFGVGQIYNSAAAGFEERRLAASLHQAASLLQQQHQQQQRRQPWQLREGDASSVGRAASSSDAESRSSSSWAVSTGAELAVLAHLALTGRLDAAELAIRLGPQQGDAPRSQHAGLAAALPILLPALQRSSSLEWLQLALPALDGADAARLEQVWQQAWQHTLPALRELLESSTAMRVLHLALPGCLQGPTAAYLPQLQAAAAAAPAAMRQQVLLALHPRAGRCSLLQLLPLPVVREILDMAAPLQPCQISICAAEPQQPAGGGGAAAGAAAAVGQA